MDVYEVRFLVLLKLPLADILKCSSLNLLWWHTVQSPQLWTELYIRDYIVRRESARSRRRWQEVNHPLNPLLYSRALCHRESNYPCAFSYIARLWLDRMEYPAQHISTLSALASLPDNTHFCVGLQWAAHLVYSTVVAVFDKISTEQTQTKERTQAVRMSSTNAQPTGGVRKPVTGKDAVAVVAGGAGKATVSGGGSTTLLLSAEFGTTPCTTTRKGQTLQESSSGSTTVSEDEEHVCGIDCQIAYPDEENNPGMLLCPLTGMLINASQINESRKSILVEEYAGMSSNDVSENEDGGAQSDEIDAFEYERKRRRILEVDSCCDVFSCC